MSSVDAQTVVSTPFLDAASIGNAASDLVTLPKGFPASVPGHKTFTGNDFEKGEGFVYHLTAAEIVEIKQALASFKGKQILSKLSLSGIRLYTYIHVQLCPGFTKTYLVSLACVSFIN